MPLDARKVFKPDQIGQIRRLLGDLDKQRMSRQLREHLDTVGGAIRARLGEDEATNAPHPVGIRPYPGTQDAPPGTAKSAVEGLRGVDWGDDSEVPQLLDFFSQKVQEALDEEEAVFFVQQEVVKPFHSLWRALEEHSCTDGIFTDLFALMKEELSHLRADDSSAAAMAKHKKWQEKLVTEMSKILDTIHGQEMNIRMNFARALHNFFIHNGHYIYAVQDKASREFPEYRNVATGRNGPVHC